MNAAVRGKGWALALIALLCAFAFLGSRPIWDPDEGRYSNVALMMLDTGNWLDLARHYETGHWTKPPLTYWLAASSMKAFGVSPWAARLPVALAYLACVLCVALAARRLWPGAGALGGLVYATMALPVLAAQVLTTDFVLAAFQVAAMCAFVEARFGPRRHAQGALLAMWALFALAFMAKGPPALLPLLAVIAMQWLAPMEKPLRWPSWLAGVAVFALLASPWFWFVIGRHDGLLAYFLGTEVVARVAGDMDRNGQWYGWLAVYAPTLLLGALPWTPALLRWCAGLRERLRRWRDAERRQADASMLLLALWVALPLAVFCLARSRLPLYVLPLFAPLALIVAGQRRAEGRGWPKAGLLVAWLALLVALRFGMSVFPTHKDASAWADAIRERTDAPVDEVVFVEDMARYGLHLYLGAQIEKVSLAPGGRVGFMPGVDGDLAEELDEHDHAATLWIARAEQMPEIDETAARLGWRVETLGAPYQGRAMFRVHRQAWAAASADREIEEWPETKESPLP